MNVMTLENYQIHWFLNHYTLIFLPKIKYKLASNVNFIHVIDILAQIIFVQINSREKLYEFKVRKVYRNWSLFDNSVLYLIFIQLNNNVEQIKCRLAKSYDFIFCLSDSQSLRSPTAAHTYNSKIVW